MKVNCYLVVSSTGKVRVNKSLPNLNWDEVKIKIMLDIPDKIFEQPQLQANITIPQEAVPESPLSAKVVDNVKEAIQKATGLNFAITVQEQKEESNGL